MANILITSVQPNSIRIMKGDDLSPTSWQNDVVNWWGSSVENNCDYIDISLSEFVLKRSWVSKNWNDTGGTYHIDDKTRRLLEDAVEEVNSFKSLLEGPVPEIDAIEIDISTYLRTPTEFQLRNIKHLLRMPSGANFSVPGAGKTSTALIVWSELRKSQMVDKLLVICPRSAFESWIAEPKEVFPNIIRCEIFDGGPIDPAAEVLITNYERLENIERFKTLESWSNRNNVQLILDEAHRVKGGSKSIRWRRCIKLATVSARVDLLTGTPMPQSFDDLRNLYALNWPTIPRSYFSDSRLANIEPGKLFVRTTKAELKLPPMNISLHDIQPGTIQKQVYDALRKRYAGTFRLAESSEAYFGSKGRAVMTLMAVASNPGLLAGIDKYDAYLGLEWPPAGVSPEQDLLDLVSNYVSYEMPPKYRWIAEFCNKANQDGRKVLIWSNLIGNIRSLEKLLAPLSPAVIFGQTPMEERRDLLKRFRTSNYCNILISNPQTLGEGVSLHKDCHEAIYLDRSYNAGQYLQSLDRIHRLGLPPEQVTNIHLLQTVGTIDERISIRLAQKVERLAEALNDKHLVELSLPEDENLPNEIIGIDQHDLNDLFEHLKK